MQIMNKKEISNQIKKAWNTTGWIEDIKIAVVGWQEYSYMIIKPEDTFKDASRDDFKPINACIYKKDFINMIYKYTRPIIIKTR